MILILRTWSTYHIGNIEMIKCACNIRITCDSLREKCDAQKEYSGADRFGAVNAARTDGWYVLNSGFTLCPTHDNARVTERELYFKTLKPEEKTP